MRQGWLWRLEATQWLAAARRELALARESSDVRRRAITHARRGAGMALNGVLVHMKAHGWSERECETAWGRSYMEHLRAVAEAEDSPLPPIAAEAASDLLSIPVVPADALVQLTRDRATEATRALQLATQIVDSCAGIVQA